LTILYGGISGGVSAEIAGGNFWAGFKQGVMTSALNHVAHAAGESIINITDPPYQHAAVGYQKKATDGSAIYGVDIYEDGRNSGKGVTTYHVEYDRDGNMIKENIQKWEGGKTTKLSPEALNDAIGATGQGFLKQATDAIIHGTKNSAFIEKAYTQGWSPSGMFESTGLTLGFISTQMGQGGLCASPNPPVFFGIQVGAVAVGGVGVIMGGLSVATKNIYFSGGNTWNISNWQDGKLIPSKW
jgi:hypothetical protein